MLELLQKPAPSWSKSRRSHAVASRDVSIKVSAKRLSRAMVVEQGLFQTTWLKTKSSRSVVCKATLDDPELEDLVAQMNSMRPSPPAKREKLEKVLKMIDDINSNDPSKVTIDGVSRPYRQVFSDWTIDWVRKLDSKAPDELLILAKGRNVESWKLSEIKRDSYPPSSVGVRMWQADRKKWVAERLESVMKEGGYEETSTKFVKEVLLERDIPDPRDMRRFDLVGALGAINFRLLEQALIVQTLKDAEALVFMEKNFPQMANRMTPEEILVALKKELGGVSQKCITALLEMPWNQVQLKMITKALPPPKRLRTIMLAAEGTAAASTHPGDWRASETTTTRKRSFDYSIAIRDSPLPKSFDVVVTSIQMPFHWPRFGLNLTKSPFFEDQVRKSFDTVDVDKDGVLCEKEVYIGLLKLYDFLNEKLPCHCSIPSMDDIKKHCAAHDVDKDGKLDFPEYLSLCRALVFTKKDWRSSMFLKISGAVLLKAALFPLGGWALKKGLVAICRDHPISEKVKKYLPTGLTVMAVEQAYGVTGQRVFPI